MEVATRSPTSVHGPPGVRSKRPRLPWGLLQPGVMTSSACVTCDGIGDDANVVAQLVTSTLTSDATSREGLTSEGASGDVEASLTTSADRASVNATSGVATSRAESTGGGELAHPLARSAIDVIAMRRVFTAREGTPSSVDVESEGLTRRSCEVMERELVGGCHARS